MNPAVTSSSPAAALQNRPALLADMQSQAEEAAEALKEEHLLPSSIAAALDAQQSGSKDGDDEHMADAQPRDSQAGASGSQLVASRIRSEEVGKDLSLMVACCLYLISTPTCLTKLQGVACRGGFIACHASF
jgi:hypothetical protein